MLLRPPAGSSVRLVVQAASLDTGNRLRDEQLRPRFGLDVEPYPHITFSSAPGEMRLSAGRVHVPGTLEVSGGGAPPRRSIGGRWASTWPVR